MALYRLFPLFRLAGCSTGVVLLSFLVTTTAHTQPPGKATVSGFTIRNGKTKRSIRTGTRKDPPQISINTSRKTSVTPIIKNASRQRSEMPLRYTLTEPDGKKHSGRKIRSKWLTQSGIYLLKARIGKKKAGAAKFILSTGSTIVQPSGNQPPFTPPGDIPLLAEWESDMLHFGNIHCQNLKNQSLNQEALLAATYYDAEWVFYQIGDYTGDPKWYECAQAAENIYGSAYVLRNNGNIPGYWNFTHGLTRDYLSTGDTNARSAALLLARTAAFASDATPASSTVSAEYSRETAYAIMSYLNAENVGDAHRPRTELLVAHALGHLDQWFGSKTAEYVRPFMFGLTAHALISYDERYGDPSILPALIQGANWIWENTWIAEEGAFQYTDRNVSSGGTEAAPDLNLLIAPVYAWIWHKTGDVTFRDRADQIFAGGVAAAYITNPKQFNQSYRWSFDYIKWRS